MAFKRITAKPKYYGIPVVSIGNLLIGGTGKTPVVIQLAQHYKKSAVVLRGYGRDSKGLYVVSHDKIIKCDIATSGDEAMMIALSVPNSTVIVSENRVEGILKAKELGCEVVFLDDGYSKHDIFKLDILLRPALEPTNLFCLPSGGYRDTKMLYAFADIVLKEKSDFKRVVGLKHNNQTLFLDQNKNYVIVTAISKPQRLLEFVNGSNVQLHPFVDHHNFTQNDIDQLQTQYPNCEFITTMKDFVKLEKYNLSNLILIDLQIEFSNHDLFEKIDLYIQQSKTV